MADGLAGEKKTPWWLKGNYAPVAGETQAFDLKVEGALPPELSGVYMRNGPNPERKPTGHWFLGDGMLHGVRLEKGKARWYRGAYVQTPLLKETDADIMDMAKMFDKTRSAANTNIVRHAGRILALEEGHFPFEISPELETKGPYDFGGKLKTAFTAHPKMCPETGDMFGFGYAFIAPFLTYHRFDAEGRLIASHEIPVNGPTMIHDFCVTRRHAIFMDLPIVFDIDWAMKGKMPFHWSDEYPARLGVMPRDGTPDQLKWFDIAPCYVFHPLNAYDEGDTVVLDTSRYARMWDKGWRDAVPMLHRFTLNMKTGAVNEAALDDAAMEFPRVAEGVAGLKHRYGYGAGFGEAQSDAPTYGTTLLKYDLQTGKRTTVDLGAGQHPGEAVFVPAAGAKEEDAGYLITYVHDSARNEADLVVLDAQEIAKGPIARVAIPARIPFGFHGNWFAD